MDRSKLPNFFVVGTGKAGTTSLHRYLSQHPQIFMSPVKEPSYFASEIRIENASDEFLIRAKRNNSQVVQPISGLVSDWREYVSLFQDVTDHKAIGESTPSYLWSETAPPNIHSQIPDAKIVMILRDPAERAFSQYLHQLAEGLTPFTFREQIDQCVRNVSTKLSIVHPFLEVGLYYRQVMRYLDLFPRDNIRIYWYEDAGRQPEHLLRDLFEFLDVDPSFEPDMSARSLARRIPRFAAINRFLKNNEVLSNCWRAIPDPLRASLRGLAFQDGRSLTMDRKDREYLIRYYTEDVRNLSGLLDRDLSSWLR